MDETYIKVDGQYKNVYRTVDKTGKTVNFFLTSQRYKKAAMRFFEKPVRASEVAEKVTMDKSRANTAVIDQIIENKAISMVVHQVKYLNTIVKQNHRTIKRVTRAILGIKSFRTAAKVLAGIERMHMIREGQLYFAGSNTLSFDDQFYALAGQIRTA